MKVLLINPPYRESTYTSPPLGVAYIASVLRNSGHSVRILDCPALKLDYRGIERGIEDFQPDIVGITAMTPVIKEAIGTARAVKSVSDIPVVLGGPHATIMPGETLRNVKEIDFIVRGEGENVMKEFLNILESGGDMRRVRGLSFKSGNRVIHNPDMPLIKDLDSIPFPARDLLPMGKYKQNIGQPKSFATMVTTRGCPFQCIYCTKAVFGSKYRFRSPENIIEGIKEILNRYGVKEIVFYDDTFTVNRERVMELCRLIVREGIKIKWKCEARADLVDQELLDNMKRAGCYIIAYGVESGNPGLLKTLKKGVTKEQIKEAFAMTKKAGIETLGYFMIGIPGETRKTIRQTLDFAIELDPDYAQFAITTPYPKTELYRMAKRKGFLKEEGWDKYCYFGDSATPVMRTESLGTGELKEELKKITKSFYFRRRYVLKQLLKSRSLHALKRNVSGMKSLLRWVK